MFCFGIPLPPKSTRSSAQLFEKLEAWEYEHAEIGRSFCHSLMPTMSGFFKKKCWVNKITNHRKLLHARLVAMQLGEVQVAELHVCLEEQETRQDLH